MIFPILDHIACHCTHRVELQKNIVDIPTRVLSQHIKSWDLETATYYLHKEL